MRESEAISGLIKELKWLESSDAVELSNKASLLAEEMKTLLRNISSHVESLRPYVDFLRSADEVYLEHIFIALMYSVRQQHICQ